MRKIIGGAFVTLDGVMQAPGGPEEDPTGGFVHGGWLTQFGDEALGKRIDALFTPPFDLLLGRRTYEIFAAYWPFMPDEGDIATKFRKARKYVLTRSDRPLEWEGSHRLPDMNALEALRRQDGPDLVIQGSTTLYPQLLKRGLIDRIVAMTAPLLLGTGKRLFGTGTPAGAWRLVEHELSGTGISMATYEPAGDVVPGSFAEIEPSQRELARRAKMEAGSW